MKEKLKKLILMTVALVAVIGMVITSDTKSTYADSNKSVKIHYLREDGSYTNYKICMWDELNQGTDYDFTVTGKEAVATYTCSSNEATAVNFILKESNGAERDIAVNRTVDVSEITEGTVDVYIKQGVEEISLEAFDTETANGSDDSKTNNNTTSVGNDKDYSVSSGMVIIIDIISIVIIVAISFLVCNKKK